MSLTTVRKEADRDRLTLIDDALAGAMDDWLGLNPFARQEKRAG